MSLNAKQFAAQKCKVVQGNVTCFTQGTPRKKFKTYVLQINVYMHMREIAVARLRNNLRLGSQVQSCEYK